MRSRYTRDLANSALAAFATAVAGHDQDFSVIGGLNADLLTDPADPPHQGTIDVDVLIEVGLVYDRPDLDFRWLEAGLTTAGFEPDHSGRAWVWWLGVGGVRVRLDLLCDVADNVGQEIALPGATSVAAQNVAGPAPALHDVVVREISLDPATGTRGGGGTVAVRFAGLGGYLLAKAAAAHHRGEPRDFYDLAYVLLHASAGSPEAVARAAADAVPPYPHVDHLALLRAALRALADPSGPAAGAFAGQRVLDGDPTDESVLRQDAAGAAIAALAELDRRSGGSL